MIKVRVQEIMTPNPACAQPLTPLRQVAKMMVDNNCGVIPVCESQTERLIGFVTDRDIVCRTIARNIDPMGKTALDVMTADLHSIKPDASIEDCIGLMERFQVRRVPVVDQDNRLVGIVSQADLARQASSHPEIGEELEEALERISVTTAI